ESLYIFYSLVDRPTRSDTRKDPLLNPKDIPWNQVDDRVISVDKAQEPDKTVNAMKQAPAVNKINASSNPAPAYRNLYESAVPLEDYPGEYYTLQLGTFEKRTDARRFASRYGIETTYIIKSRTLDR